MTSTIRTRSTSINTVTARSNTSHVLAAIDGALNDWQVSKDAMRWTPDPATRSSRPNTSGELWAIDDDGAARRVGGITSITFGDDIGDPGVGPAESVIPSQVATSALDAVLDAMHADIAASQQQRQLDGLRHINELHAQIETMFGRPRRRRAHTEPPADPKAHALHARQHRNTGPAKPAAGHRPPRTLVR